MGETGRWAHVTGRPVSVWLVARCWCCRLAPKSPTDVSSSLLVHRLYPAGLSLCHGPQPASCGFRKITARPIVKLACPILRPPVASSAAPSPNLVADRRPPTAEFSKTTYIRIQLPIRLSVLSQQPVAGLSCVVYQACPRSRPTVQATARLQKPAPPRNPGSTPLSDKALDEDDTALEAASSVPPSLQRPVSPARPCPPSLWHTGTQESLVPGPDAWSPAAGSGKISGIRFSFAQSDLIYPWKPLPTHTHTHTHIYDTPPRVPELALSLTRSSALLWTCPPTKNHNLHSRYRISFPGSESVLGSRAHLAGHLYQCRARLSPSSPCGQFQGTSSRSPPTPTTRRGGTSTRDRHTRRRLP